MKIILLVGVVLLIGFISFVVIGIYLMYKFMKNGFHLRGLFGGHRKRGHHGHHGHGYYTRKHNSHS